MSEPDETAPEAQAESLAAEFLLVPPPAYEPMDRYRDFRRVFLGSDEGKRVLFEIMRMGRMANPTIPPGKPIDPLGMAVMNGERNLVLRLLAIIAHEPAAKPAAANTKPKD